MGFAFWKQFFIAEQSNNVDERIDRTLRTAWKAPTG
jgi:hypothetical protein